MLVIFNKYKAVMKFIEKQNLVCIILVSDINNIKKDKLFDS